ncbi:hypothetical protein VTJ04DRAFT_6932 [Mycothermus thermophilus]|uniref:uncharacterized protein n=1 Tax=Humicola insolens TaxID=85995 RepID=UPI0037439812
MSLCPRIARPDGREICRGAKQARQPGLGKLLAPHPSRSPPAASVSGPRGLTYIFPLIERFRCPTEAVAYTYVEEPPRSQPYYCYYTPRKKLCNVKLLSGSFCETHQRQQPAKSVHTTLDPITAMPAQPPNETANQGVQPPPNNSNNSNNKEQSVDVPDLRTPPHPEPDDENNDDAAKSVAGFSHYSHDLSVDNDYTDDEANGGGITSPSSASVASSVYEFVEENGRTWHKYKEGKYYLPNDAKEQSRLDYQHKISKILLGGKLSLAPVENPKRVLDLGTGTGIWAVEYAEQHPNSNVLGVDLSPIQPEYVPPNCVFEVDDIDDDWVYQHKFDFIHARYLLPFVKKKWPVLFKDIYDNLNPGGWVESQETIVYFQAVDNSLEGTALQRWNALLLEGIQKTGRSATEAVRVRHYLAEAGFVNIREKKFAVPMNPWAKGKEQKEIGSMQLVNNLEGIDGITIGVFTRVLGWKKEDVDKLLVDVKKDLANKNIHAYITILVAWGQKPL